MWSDSYIIYLSVQGNIRLRNDIIKQNRSADREHQDSTNNYKSISPARTMIGREMMESTVDMAKSSEA